jgi:hypothetical protein
VGEKEEKNSHEKHTINFFHRKTKSQVQNTFNYFIKMNSRGRDWEFFWEGIGKLLYRCVVSKVA